MAPTPVPAGLSRAENLQSPSAEAKRDEVKLNRFGARRNRFDVPNLPELFFQARQ
jgi:hypothetical protein